MNRREILFRGKRAHPIGEWVYGSLLNNRTAMEGSAYIIPFFVDSSNFDYIEVYPHTIGQFTGLTDKNGVKIWEGDLVRYEAIVKTDSEGNNAFFIGSIEYWSGSVGCGWRYKSGRSTMMIKTSHPWRMEVIGTIHDTHLTQQS